MKFKFNFILLILLFVIKNICYESNGFEFKLVNETMNQGTYISSTISENGYLYIVTGPDEILNDEDTARYIMRMNLNTLSLNYYLDYPIKIRTIGYLNCESYSYTAKGYYLFNIAPGWIESFNLQRQDLCASVLNNYNGLYGNRGKMFKKLGSYYYLIFISEHDYLVVEKKKIKEYHKECDIPIFDTIGKNTKILVNNKNMISCDSTKDNNYILCAFLDENSYVGLAVYNTELGLEVSYKHPDLIKSFYFIKLLYMKNNADFILMYSFTEQTTRLKYIYKENNTIKNKIGSIIGSTNNYLDIVDTQNFGYYGSNDIVKSGNDKVIKVYGDAPGNIIIITIIQFYENDSYMTVKIYNMENRNGFNYFQQSRISMARDSIVFCASAEKNNIRRPGYSLINYPYVADKTLITSSISVENLDLKLDTFFHATPKLKILSIPSHMIIENLNSKIIRENDELELNDIITIKKYRTNESNFIIEYQAIAKGNDLGYKSIKKYPPDKDIKDYNVIFIEGRKGQMKFNIKYCLDGFYRKEDDINLCSKYGYNGYYLDIKNKIWRLCPFPCGNCGAPINSTHKNCLDCLDGYYLTEDTKYCYKEILPNYYKDGKTLRRCHKDCLSCSTGSKDDYHMKCTKCYPNWYLTEDTQSCFDKIIVNYYKDGDFLRRCHKNCLYCSTGSKDDNNMNCTKCYPNWYLTEDTHSCYNKTIENYYIDGNMLKRCHKKCLYCSTGSKDDNNMNCTKCYPNWYLTEDTHSCYNKTIENYYIDGNMLKRCHKKCLFCSTKGTNFTHMNCLECYDKWYLTEDTKSCYNDIIDNYYLFNKTNLKRCHKNCLHCTTNEKNDNYMNCTKCVENFYMTEDTNSCYDKVIDNYYLDNNTLRRCHPNCLKCSTGSKNNTYMNCLKCQDNFYMTEDTYSCYDKVIDNYYLDNATLRRCHPNCLKCSTGSKNNIYMNCTKCFENFYMTEDTNSCYDKVIDNYYLDNNTLRRCHPNCLKCSTGSKNNTYMNCTKCIKNFFMIENKNSCNDYIPNNYYLDNSTYQLRKCFSRCSNCIGAKNNKTQNCLGCSNDTYYYKRDTLDCILKEEITKSETKEFYNKDSIYFYIFIGIFIAAILILVINCIFYQIKEQKKNSEQKKEINNEHKKPNDYQSLQNKSDDESSNNSNIIND